MGRRCRPAIERLNQVDPAQVILRFDYKILAGEKVPRLGTPHQPARDWLVDASPTGIPFSKIVEHLRRPGVNITLPRLPE